MMCYGDTMKHTQLILLMVLLNACSVDSASLVSGPPEAGEGSAGMSFAGGSAGAGDFAGEAGTGGAAGEPPELDAGLPCDAVPFDPEVCVWDGDDECYITQHLTMPGNVMPLGWDADHAPDFVDGGYQCTRSINEGNGGPFDPGTKYIGITDVRYGRPFLHYHTITPRLILWNTITVPGTYSGLLGVEFSFEVESLTPTLNGPYTVAPLDVTVVIDRIGWRAGSRVSGSLTAEGVLPSGQEAVLEMTFDVILEDACTLSCL